MQWLFSHGVFKVCDARWLFTLHVSDIHFSCLYPTLHSFLLPVRRTNDQSSLNHQLSPKSEARTCWIWMQGPRRCPSSSTLPRLFAKQTSSLLISLPLGRHSTDHWIIYIVIIVPSLISIKMICMDKGMQLQSISNASQVPMNKHTSCEFTTPTYVIQML